MSRPRFPRGERGLVIQEYARALEDADFEVMERIHKLAETDPLLERELDILTAAALALLEAPPRAGARPRRASRQRATRRRRRS